MGKDLIEIEKEILSNYIVSEDYVSLKQPDKGVLDRLEELFEKRQALLDKMFTWSPENTEKVRRVNDQLRMLSSKLHERTNAMYQKASFICDDPDFDDDYEIEGTLGFFYNGPESILILNDDSEYGSNFPRMINALSEYYHANPGWIGKYMMSIKPGDENMDDKMNWNESPLSHPGIAFCYVCHNFCCHALYSIPDLIRLNDFWSEVHFTEQNFSK